MSKRKDHEPTVEEDQENLNPDQQAIDEKVEKNPPEVGKNHADWEEGRDPKDVVEVEGQRETVESKMNRGGPQTATGASTSSI